MNKNKTTNSLANILLVDDHPENLRFLYTMLSNRGYQPRGVINGKMALKAARKNPPDLILLDIMMPEMDGYQICQQLKNDETTREIPIIFISAKGESSDIVNAFTVGGVDYITKPFQIEEVLARIENHLTLHRLRRQLQQQNIILQQEIISRERAEAALEKSNQELARSNSELERFAYVASHDLLAPLASITIYAQLLEGRDQEKLDEQASKFISKILKGCSRMQRLIDDLLEYSRVDSNQDDFESIDCNLVFEEACTNLQAAIYNSQASITHTNLPTIIADKSQIVQLFQNLISNAIKYCRQESPIIHVSAILKEDSYLFSIQDNGIGIDSQYSTKIFQIFQRLHNRSEYPGTGIGLAICQKIVERHGGRIWVESEPGKGSTFYFTINSNC